MLQRTIEILAQKCGTLKFSPHVTLLGQLSQKEKWIQIQLEQLSRASLPFQLDMNELSMVDQYFRSITLKVFPNPQLDRLYRNAVRTFKNSPENPYCPHLSLLYSDLQAAKKKQLMEDIVLPLPLSIQIGEVAIVKTEGKPGQWREIARFPFHSSTPRLNLE